MSGNFWVQIIVDEKREFPSLHEMEFMFLPTTNAINPNLRGKHSGNTLLHILCETIEALWIDVEQLDIDDIRHPNHELAKQFKLMLSLPNIDVNILNENKLGVIHILKNAKPILRLLLNFRGTNVDLMSNNSNNAVKNETAFYKMCKDNRGDLETLRMFLQAGCDPNIGCRGNTTNALHALVEYRNATYTLHPITRYTFYMNDKKTNEDHLQRRKDCDREIFPKVQLLLKCGANPNARVGAPLCETIFYIVLVYDWPVDMINMFLDYEADPLLVHFENDQKKERIIDICSRDKTLDTWLKKRLIATGMALNDKSIPTELERLIMESSVSL